MVPALRHNDTTYDCVLDEDSGQNCAPPVDGYSAAMSDARDKKFMRLALAEARKGTGTVSPNPAVGAVLVRGERVISKGHHRGVGLAHAEIECLAGAPSGSINDATLYVTLEPCSTLGRTPPCTEAIVREGVARVVIGATDVNPRHNGRGIDQLRAAGVEVTDGVLGPECSRLNEPFNKWIVTGRPFVIAKCGMSLDGRLMRQPNEKRWLTGPAARRDAMELRSQVDAILIGAETLRQDDPRLTVRGMARAKQPYRVIVSRSGKLPRQAHVFTDRFADRTLVYRAQPLARIMADLGKKEITSVLIEGGGDVLGQAFDAQLVDKIQFYIAPILTGGPILAVAGKGAASTKEGARLRDISFRELRYDLCVTGYPRWAE